VVFCDWYTLFSKANGTSPLTGVAEQDLSSAFEFFVRNPSFLKYLFYRNDISACHFYYLWIYFPNNESILWGPFKKYVRCRGGRGSSKSEQKLIENGRGGSDLFVRLLEKKFMSWFRKTVLIFSAFLLLKDCLIVII